MELTERQEQILKAVFDNYVRKEIIEKNSISSQEDISLNEPELNIDCRSYDLYVAVITSYCRITSEELPKKIEDSIKSEATTEKVMLLVVKEHLKQLTVAPLGFPRYLKNIVGQLNEENRDLNTDLKELMDFIHPIYLNGIKEILKIA